MWHSPGAAPVAGCTQIGQQSEVGALIGHTLPRGIEVIHKLDKGQALSVLLLPVIRRKVQSSLAAGEGLQIHIPQTIGWLAAHSDGHQQESACPIGWSNLPAHAVLRGRD